ncbi:MAG: hydrogenase nickel incorporation protein HypB [Bacteroidetes bacterium]|nr:hydrogenase nickel incorporation protein HypB [Bacteroidota bacterium]
MCATCGCDQPGGVTITRFNREDGEFRHVSNHGLVTAHHHHHGGQESSSEKRRIDLQQDILSKNDTQAGHNRHHFEAGHILAVNLVSSPGSGKTSLLERTLADLKDQYKSYVIEGDQQTLNDANRIAATGCEVVQINTGKGCHLDADMIHRSIHQLDPQDGSVVFIENVGNLVCPAMFDLGEQARVAIISVTEGDDKPLKYPDMFESSQLCIINKIDLLPYVNFSVEKTKEYARKVNPRLSFIELSATRGDGMGKWYEWLKNEYEAIGSRKEVAASV